MIVPLPLTSDQVPVPEVGVTAFKKPSAEHTIAFAPALAVEGGAKLFTNKSALEGGQVPLVIVHRNLLIPGVKPLTVELN
jgi:hypothetical protein